MTSTESSVDHPPFEWVGGRPCLDFTNTVTWLPDGALTSDRIASYGDLLAWAREGGVIGEREHAALAAEARRHPVATSRVLARALAARRTIHSLFTSRARGETPAPADVRRFDELLREALGHLRVAPGAEGYAWSWREEARDLARVLWPVIWSAARELTSSESRWVRSCANERCGWLFIDESRNRNRRWCDMRDCGSRAKARRHYARRKSRGSAPTLNPPSSPSPRA